MKKVFRLCLDRSGSFKKNGKGVLYFWKLEKNVYILTKELSNDSLYEIDYIKDNNIFIKPFKDSIDEAMCYNLSVINTENYYLTEKIDDMYLINRNKSFIFDIIFQKKLDFGKLFLILYLDNNDKKLFDIEIKGESIIEVYKKNKNF